MMGRQYQNNQLRYVPEPYIFEQGMMQVVDSTGRGTEKHHIVEYGDSDHCDVLLLNLYHLPCYLFDVVDPLTEFVVFHQAYR